MNVWMLELNIQQKKNVKSFLAFFRTTQWNFRLQSFQEKKNPVCMCVCLFISRVVRRSERMECIKHHKKWVVFALSPSSRSYYTNLWLTNRLFIIVVANNHHIFMCRMHPWDSCSRSSSLIFFYLWPSTKFIHVRKNKNYDSRGKKNTRNDRFGCSCSIFFDCRFQHETHRFDVQ